uniref:Ubiquitin-like protease family profile domain-containing protein n=1 Tax=Lactuca sativa TaxID=4236 RepID=A0A9R1XIA1_LACSA|nr:hypothetical protein LSAT_V11C400207330 [Lactuca sativa]
MDNHMDLPVQKASITVTDVMDVPQQEGMFGECGVSMLMYTEQLVSGQPIERLEELKKILAKFNWPSTSTNKPSTSNREKMDNEMKKMLLQREANVDKAYKDFAFQRKLLDNYWDDIDCKKN